MAAPIAPGDWVECVDASPGWDGLPVPFVVGGLYRVTEVIEGNEWHQAGRYVREFCVGLLFEGVPQPSDDGSYNAVRFRPIYRPSEKLIEQLSQPVDLPADEPVSVTA